MRSLYRVLIISSMLIAFSLAIATQIQSKDLNSSRNKQLASVDGVAITEAQVRLEGSSDLESLELKSLQMKAANAQREYEILEESLQSLVEEKLLMAEASRKGISKEELLAQELSRDEKEPTPEEVESFYAVNEYRIRVPKEEALPQIVSFLKQQRQIQKRAALIERLETEHKVVRFLEPLRFEFKTSGPSQGPASAPVVLVLFSDFQCPYCKTFNETLKEILKQYDQKVRLVFRQFPLTSIHADAQRAAEASLCAGAQNRFWEMHDLLFENQKNLKENDIKDRAKKLGLNMDAFNSCLASNRYSKQVREDARVGSSAGTDGTPTLFINGRHLTGGRSYPEVAAIIDEELSLKKPSR
jgi:protein-disulfide isomerase